MQRFSAFDLALQRQIVEAFTEIDLQSGCWLWMGGTSAGYAALFGRTLHRRTYAAFNGPIPEGLHIDHVCGIRRCCNPGHLEAVTQTENNRRAMARAVARGQQHPGERVFAGAKRWCVRGHQFNDENTGRDRHGKRYCKPCRLMHVRRMRRDAGQKPRPREWHVSVKRYWELAEQYPRNKGEEMLSNAEVAKRFEINTSTFNTWRRLHRDELDLPQSVRGKTGIKWPSSQVEQLLASWTDEPWDRRRKDEIPGPRRKWKPKSIARK